MRRLVFGLVLALAAPCYAQPVCDWTPLGGGANDAVRSMTVFDDGSGPALCVGGAFTTAGGEVAGRVAKWDGSQWTPLATEMNNEVRVLAVLDLGDGPALYAGGSFSSINGNSGINRIARLENDVWVPVGNGIGGNPLTTPAVVALTVLDAGAGPILYAGGGFTTAGGSEIKGIARWDGASWSSVGSGLAVSGPVGSSPYVLTMLEHDDGSGPAIYVGGGFTIAGGQSANNIARWNGSSWTPLGAGLNGPVEALVVFDDGAGPAIYAAGGFTASGTTSLNRVAKWDGIAWSPIGIGLNNTAGALTVFDDGTGPALYVGGTFTSAGGSAAGRLAKWTGDEWMPLAAGVNGTVRALIGLDTGSGELLYAGGSFTSAGGMPHSRVVGSRCWSDCNDNGLPDHIETTSGAEADCNANFVPDACERAVHYGSPTESPFTGLSPLVYTISDPIAASSIVSMQIRVRASLFGASRFVSIRIDGTTVTTFFAADGQDCPTTPQIRTLELTAAQFNAFASDGSVVVELVPSPAVTGCNISFAELSIAYQTLPDCDGDGVWDECQLQTHPFLDCNLNGSLDSCEAYSPDPRDCDGDDVPDECELAIDPSLDLNMDGRLDLCSYALGDFNLDSVVDGADLSVLLSIWGIRSPEIGDLNDDGTVDGADLSILLSNWGSVRLP